MYSSYAASRFSCAVGVSLGSVSALIAHTRTTMHTVAATIAATTAFAPTFLFSSGVAIREL